MIGKRVKWEEHLPEPLALDYTRKPKIDWDRVQEREWLLNALVGDAAKVLVAVADLELSPQEEQLVRLLETVAGQDVERGEGGKVRLKRGVAHDRVVSVTDPEMRHGHKSREQRFDGFKTQVAVDTESEFITGVVVSPGNVHDSEAICELVEILPEKPEA